MKTYTSQELQDPANSAILEEIILVISLSFLDDAGTKWLFFNHSRQSYVKALPKYKRMLVDLALRCDAAITVMTKDEIAPRPNSDNKNTSTNQQSEIPLPPHSTIRAVSITIPPHGNATFDSNVAAIRAGVLLLPFRCGWDMTWRLLARFLPNFHKMHDEMFPDPAMKYHNHHLFYLATHPDCRGQGVGKRMLLELQKVVKQLNDLEEAKAKQNGEKFIPAPFYLEASNAENRRLYSRVGFEDRSTLVYGKLGDNENLNIAKDGRVIGGRMFGMVWMP